MPFTQQQLEDAFAQMTQERADDATYAQSAADKLAKLLGNNAQIVPEGEWRNAITPFTAHHNLVIRLSQYDDWQAWYNSLVTAGVQMQAWSGKYNPGPKGEFDVSGDAHFSGRPKQKYVVLINICDSDY